MEFLKKHPYLLLLVGGVGVYLWLNPAGRFGIARESLVIYNRMPVPLFDLYIAPDGSRTIFENLGKQSNSDELCDLLKAQERRNPAEVMTIIVGWGFGEKPLFLLSEVRPCSRLMMNQRVIEMSSSRAVRRYNEMRDQGRNVAIILKVKPD
jgi:hypothetical protein